MQLTIGELLKFWKSKTYILSIPLPINQFKKVYRNTGYDKNYPAMHDYRIEDDWAVIPIKYLTSSFRTLQLVISISESIDQCSDRLFRIG